MEDAFTKEDGTWQFGYYGPAELVICAVEAAAYVLLLKEHDRRRRIGYAVLANAASAVLGYFPLHLLYDSLKSL